MQSETHFVVRYVLKAICLNVSIGRRPILKDVSVDFRAGRFTALIGANGSGKSTLLRSLMGLAPVQSGQVLVEETPLSGMRPRQIARRMAYLPQTNVCPDHLTVGELVELAGFARTGLFGTVGDATRAQFREALRTVGLDGAEATQVSRLSGGQRQRAFIAMVLAQDTPLLMMDEPVNHLDLKYQYAVLDLVRGLVTEQGKTLIMVLHDLNLALSYADDVVVLEDGRVLTQGPAREVLDSATVARAFGVEAEMSRLGERLVCLPKGARMVGRT
ncbi:ABC transporter ATP-binding protein [Alloyangia pacifica]|uniref:Iron complex transport system ATP-binding protein n=1 Tax=Alloyangia pacifica TaxID=311180 RepID=A0A1I6SY09_9RHOB|nr:ABC transporter ATP-binding protein [Alloyangia pacifica]SDG91009.1 iron complex transport system ATP-binding protein [Alloyangia pacifica]SFS81809.1 iron complex transport system ATP-binding protein [Alloyangia pacifica]